MAKTEYRTIPFKTQAFSRFADDILPSNLTVKSRGAVPHPLTLTTKSPGRVEALDRAKL
jgi:hypothetical protein